MKKRLLAWLLCLVLLAAGIPAALAEEAGPIDLGRDCSLTVAYQYDEDNKLEGALFDLYRVGELDADGNVTLTEDYAISGLKIELENTENWGTAAETFAGIARRKELPPLKTASTNAEGKGDFGTLKPAVYLVAARRYEQGDYRYYGKPALVSLPLRNENAGGGWSYDVTVRPKTSRVVKAQDYLEVIIIWRDNGYETRRPKSVLVDLYCDGEVVDTREVSAAMGWEYKWDPLPMGLELVGRGESWYVGTLRVDTEAYAAALDADVTIDQEHSWYVEERNADNYTKSYEASGRRLVIINTIKSGPANPGEKLPQTGMLWWPVPVLAISGLVLLVVGLGLGRKKRYE